MPVTSGSPEPPPTSRFQSLTPPSGSPEFPHLTPGSLVSPPLNQVTQSPIAYISVSRATPIKQGPKVYPSPDIRELPPPTDSLPLHQGRQSLPPYIKVPRVHPLFHLGMQSPSPLIPSPTSSFPLKSGTPEPHAFHQGFQSPASLQQGPQSHPVEPGSPEFLPSCTSGSPESPLTLGPQIASN